MRRLLARSWRRSGLGRRAVVLVVVGLALLGVGRTLALSELFVAGVACFALVAAAAVLVGTAPVGLLAERRVVPPRIHVGGACRVDLHLRNPGRRRTPVVLARDPFDGGRRHARFRVAPLDPGATVAGGYRVPSDRRGVFDVGPLEVVRSDPFGLATRRLAVAGATTITVYPHVDRIAPLPHSRGRDPRGGTVSRPALGAGGDEFYALRPYVIGDDLRRVHWASSARSDDLLVRQDESPWEGRVALVVDVRAGAHTEQSFETAMSVAASILLASEAAGTEVRLVLTDGTDTGGGSGHAHLELLLERLAQAEPDHDRARTLALTCASLGRQVRESALCVVATCRSGEAELAALARLRTGAVGATVVLLEEAGGTIPAAVGPAAVAVRDLASFPRTWEAAMHTRRAGAAAGGAR